MALRGEVLDVRLVEDAPLLLRALTAALVGAKRNYHFTFVLRDGTSERCHLYHTDPLTLADRLQELREADALEAIALDPLCSDDDAALIHFPTRRLYLNGPIAEKVSAAFREVLVPDERPALDMRDVVVWRRRYPREVRV